MKTLKIKFTQDVGLHTGKIPQIKALRKAAGIGLKPAKDAVEESYDTGKAVVVEIDRLQTKARLLEGLQELRNMPTVTVFTASSSDGIVKIKRLVTTLVRDGDYDLAQALIEVVKEHDI